MIATTSEAKVRPASWEDRKSIFRIARLSPFTKGIGGHKWLLMLLPQLCADGFVAVAQIGDVVAGFVILDPKKRKPITRLQWMGVDPNFQRRGIGRALLEWSVLRNPWKEIQLHVNTENTAARTMYEHFGFKVLEETVSPSGWPELLMSHTKADALPRQ